MPESWQLSVAEIALGIRTGDLSSEEIVRALLARIEKLEPRLHAWETLDADGALAAAHQADARRGKGGPLPPLLGVPVGIKDIIFTRWLRTTMHSPIFADFAPSYDAAVVERLQTAGAVILGKTATTPFAFLDPAETRNPWDQGRTPGGSSSGSGAAVAAGMVPAALGTQTGGSVLRPAAYCGVVGLKPSFGRISRHGIYPDAATLDTPGILARTVEDAALLLEPLAGHDPRDPMTSEEPVEDYRAQLGRTPPPRLAVLRDYADRSSAAAQAHLQDVIGRAEAAGAEVREARLPLDLDLALATHAVVMQVEMTATHAALLARHPDQYAPKLRAYVEVGEFIPAAAYIQAQRQRRRLRDGVDALLGEVDALILPTVSDVPPDPSTTGDPSFQGVFTLLGVPAITVPTGLSGGLPLGTQLVGRRFGEASLLAVAGWLEQTIGTIGAPPL